jgi:CubicO group peptidase (beta-lactamase class C family)
VNLAMSNLLPAETDIRLLNDMMRTKTTKDVVGFGAGGFVLIKAGPTEKMGPGSYGWGGAAGTVFWVDPATGVRATGMINRIGDSGKLKDPLATAVYSDLVPTPN